nr:helix-turn-helix transcriptional regulator [uncultured Chryseobacterium sp.]
MQNKKIHQGKNIKRFREMLGIKQEALAFDLGDDWNQKKVSLLEQKEIVDENILEKISEILNVPREALENMNEEQAVNIIANTFNNSAFLNGMNINSTIHPVDKLFQLHEEKIALYERMLKEKDEMMAELKRISGLSKE